MNTKIIKIDVPQSKPTKDGSLLYQELDSSHVRRQTPEKLEAERKRESTGCHTAQERKWAGRDSFSE